MKGSFSLIDALIIRVFIILLFVTGFLTSAMWAQETVPVLPRVSGGTKTVGAPFVYWYFLPHMAQVPSISLSFDDPSGNEDIVVATQSVRKQGDGVRFRSELISFVTGPILFPSSNIGSYSVLPLTVTIDSVIDARTTVNLKPSVGPLTDISDILLALCIVLFLFLIAFLVSMWRRSRLTAPKILTPEQKHRRWERACAFFQDSTYPEAPKTYYIESSEVLKRFLADVWQVDILDQTSSEAHMTFKQHPITQQEALLACLDSGDMVKFAKYHPSPDEFSCYREAALRFILAHEPPREGVE